MKCKKKVKRKNGKPNKPGEEKTPILVRRHSINDDRPNYSGDPEGFISTFQKKSQILTHHIQQLISDSED
ncbi:hypothetical protein QQF64_018205 [Cirrhinus molitorella]|uniref:Uncharacterized protein n=1 Tax=Cirrhinus molitorella TaxID=172907 RepID=A0ABR3LPG0_9TELE